jgi:hypothetical protein
MAQRNKKKGKPKGQQPPEPLPDVLPTPTTTKTTSQEPVAVAKPASTQKAGRKGANRQPKPEVVQHKIPSAASGEGYFEPSDDSDDEVCRRSLLLRNSMLRC